MTPCHASQSPDLRASYPLSAMLASTTPCVPPPDLHAPPSIPSYSSPLLSLVSPFHNALLPSPTFPSMHPSLFDISLSPFFSSRSPFFFTQPHLAHPLGQQFKVRLMPAQRTALRCCCHCPPRRPTPTTAAAAAADVAVPAVKLPASPSRGVSGSGRSQARAGGGRAGAGEQGVVQAFVPTRRHANQLALTVAKHRTLLPHAHPLALRTSHHPLPAAAAAAVGGLAAFIERSPSRRLCHHPLLPPDASPPPPPSALSPTSLLSPAPALPLSFPLPMLLLTLLLAAAAAAAPHGTATTIPDCAPPASPPPTACNLLLPPAPAFLSAPPPAQICAVLIPPFGCALFLAASFRARRFRLGGTNVRAAFGSALPRKHVPVLLPLHEPEDKAQQQQPRPDPPIATAAAAAAAGAGNEEAEPRVAGGVVRGDAVARAEHQGERHVYKSGESLSSLATTTSISAALFCPSYGAPRLDVHTPPYAILYPTDWSKQYVLLVREFSTTGPIRHLSSENGVVLTMKREEMAGGEGERVAALEAKLREQGEEMGALKAELARMRAAAERQAAEVAEVKATVAHSEARINDVELALAALTNSKTGERRDEPDEGGARKKRKPEESPGKEGDMAGAAAGTEPTLTVGGSAAEGQRNEAESESEEEWGANGEEDFDAEAELQELCDRVVALEKNGPGAKTWEVSASSVYLVFSF
ncbi:unnamed protein product [Closterium sp. Naga37s-1]|nr:unnamed protein product [Closterium sp. Naga37s-1]